MNNLDAIEARLASLVPIFEALDLRLAVLEQGIEAAARDSAQTRANVHRLLSVSQAQLMTLEALVSFFEADAPHLRKVLQDALRKDEDPNG